MVIIDHETGEIQISKGDTVSLNVAVRVNDMPYTLQTGDILILSIKSKLKDNINDYPNVVLEATNDGGTSVNFELNSENISNCDYGQFLYDIKIKYANGDKYALTLPTQFTIINTVGNMV